MSPKREGRMLPNLRIDEHATYEKVPRRRSRSGDGNWQSRKRQSGHALVGPLSTDETAEEREALVESLKGERINPVFAAEYLDGYIRRCK